MNPTLHRQADPDLASIRAEDIAHEVLLRLREKGEGKPVWQSSYWRKAAYHAVIDELRRQSSPDRSSVFTL